MAGVGGAAVPGRLSLAGTEARPTELFSCEKIFTVSLSFCVLLPIALSRKGDYVSTLKKNRFFPCNSPDFSPEKDPKAPGLVTYHALTAIWRLPSRFSGGDKMGMIAFYAGLFIGVLFGFLLSSLWAHFRAKPEDSVLPDPAEGYSQVDPLKP
jgi:hypothetical protein